VLGISPLFESLKSSYIIEPCSVRRLAMGKRHRAWVRTRDSTANCPRFV